MSHDYVICNNIVYLNAILFYWEFYHHVDIWPLITQINTSVTGTKFPVLNYSTRNSIDVLLYMHYLYWFSSVMRIAMNNLCICTVYLVYPALGHLSFCYLWLGILSVCHETFSHFNLLMENCLPKWDQSRMMRIHTKEDNF